MKQKHTVLIIAAALAVMLFAAVSLAAPQAGADNPRRQAGPAFGLGERGPQFGQDGERPQRDRSDRLRGGPFGHMLKRADANEDGTITKEEFTQSLDEVFNRFDKNQDGVIDATELENSRPNRMAGEAGEGRPDLGEMLMGRMDANEDGKIAAAEWKGPEERFKQMDVNQDGEVDAAEIEDALHQMRQRFNAAGGEGDRLKQRRNSRGEAPEGDAPAPDAPEGDASEQRRKIDPEKRVQRMIQHLDANEDGKISADEFRGPEEAFEKIDANGDGQLTSDELINHKPPRRGTREGGEGRKKGPRQNQ
ncbi:MAG: EF-hand domain-containing protein [Candidatus Sumerlaeia bacterium]